MEDYKFTNRNALPKSRVKSLNSHHLKNNGMAVALALLGLIMLSLLAMLVLSTNAVLILLTLGALQCAFVAVGLKETHFVKAHIVVQIYVLTLCVASILCCYRSMPPTAVIPYLMGSDGQLYFTEALALQQGDIFDQLASLRTNYLGFQVLLAITFTLLGPELMAGVMINNIALIAAIVIVVRVTFRLTGSASAAAFAAMAFALTFRFIFYANALLKEPYLILGVALLLHGFVSLAVKKRAELLAYAEVAMSVLIFGTMRQPFLILVPFGLLLLGKRIAGRGLIIVLLGGLAAGSLGSIFSKFTSHEFSDAAIESTLFQNSVLTEALGSGLIDSAGIVGNFMRSYGDLPLFARIILLPGPAAVQFALPFDFWSTLFIDDHVLSVFNANLNIIWYLYVGVFFVYAVLHWRRLPNYTLQVALGLGVCMYLFVAFIFSGVVPRYGSPGFVLIYPALGYWMHVWKRGGSDGAKIGRFFGIYYASFAAFSVAYLAFKASS